MLFPQETKSAMSVGKKMSNGTNYADKSTNGPDLLKKE